MTEKTTYNNVSNEAMAKATGKTWEEWFAILDAADATRMSHKEIAQWLYDNHLKKDWWCQSLTVGYEQARGMRKANQKLDGFTVGVSKTMPFPVAALYAAWAEPAERAKWLDGGDGLGITTANRDKNIRGKWGDGKSVVIVNFYPKDGRKTQVVIQHERLAEESDVEAMRNHWKRSLDSLQQLLTQG